ncbi:hypothetical protein ACFLUV_01510 [Elusimicrobiota bacterium]
MNKFFEDLSYPHFIRCISTVSKKEIKSVIMELELGTSNSDKNIRRLYNAITGDKKIKEEPADSLVNAVFVTKLPGGQIGLHQRYKDLFIDLLDKFKIPHEEGFIGEKQEKEASKRFKKVKLSHLQKYLKDKISEDNKFEYFFLFRYLFNYRKLVVFLNIIEKNSLLKDIISK